jgi:hypothetical protein
LRSKTKFANNQGNKNADPVSELYLPLSCATFTATVPVAALHRAGVDAALAFAKTISQEILGEIAGDLILAGAGLIARDRDNSA